MQEPKYTVSIQLTQAQHERLKKLAHGMSIYTPVSLQKAAKFALDQAFPIVERLLDEDLKARVARRAKP